MLYFTKYINLWLLTLFLCIIYNESSKIRVINKPDIFILGCPKCGTTSLHALMILHPEMCTYGKKEKTFFIGAHATWHEKLDEYEKVWM